MAIIESIPELVCPLCKGELIEQGESLSCRHCSKVYRITDGIADMLDDDIRVFAEEIAVQDRVACEYESKRYQFSYAARYHQWWTDLMLKQVSKSGRFLDNGCGIDLLSEKLSPGQVVGLDISSEMLRTAVKKNKQLVLGNSQQLPFKDSSFDVVFCRSLIHHLPQPEQAIKEISRVLKKAGEVVFVDTNTSLLSSLPRRIANKGEHFSEEHKNLNRKFFEKSLESDFKIEKVIYFGYIAYPVLGFPDILGLFKYIPFKRFFEPVLMAIDGLISKIPVLRTQSWAVLVKAVKR